MSHKLSLSLVAVFCLSVAMRVVSSASTKEVYLESDLKVKGETSAEDLAQFLEDQPHLADDKQDGTTTEEGNPVVGNPFSNLPFTTNAIDLYQLASMLSQLGIPMVTPTSIAQAIISGPMGFVSQFLGGLGSRYDEFFSNDISDDYINKNFDN